MKWFWKEFSKRLCKTWIFSLQNNSVENSLICPKTKSASHCPTELFPIYPNNHWTIRRRDDHIVVPSSNRIKLKIDWLQLFHWLHQRASQRVNQMVATLSRFVFQCHKTYLYIAMALPDEPYRSIRFCQKIQIELR